MFTQKSLDQMSIDEVISLSRRIAKEVADRSHNPYDALDYVNQLSVIVDNLRERFEAVTEDVA